LQPRFDVRIKSASVYRIRYYYVLYENYVSYSCVLWKLAICNIW